MLMPVDAKTFIFKIIEPESNLMTSLSVSLEEALTEKQLATLNRKDLAKLKLLAKVWMLLSAACIAETRGLGMKWFFALSN